MFGLCCVVGGCWTEKSKLIFLCSDCLIHALSMIKKTIERKELIEGACVCVCVCERETERV